jgi:hypothetical protein
VLDTKKAPLVLEINTVLASGFSDQRVGVNLGVLIVLAKL